MTFFFIYILRLLHFFFNCLSSSSSFFTQSQSLAREASQSPKNSIRSEEQRGLSPLHLSAAAVHISESPLRFFFPLTSFLSCIYAPYLGLSFFSTFFFQSWSFANILGLSWILEVLTFPPFLFFWSFGISLGVIPPVWESFSAFIFAIINSYSLLLTFGPDTQRPVLVSISEVGKGLGKGKWSTTQCPATQIRSWFPRRERDL